MKTRSNFTANDILPGYGYCLPRYLPAYAGFYSSVMTRTPGEAVGYRTTKDGKKHYIQRICIGLPCFVQRVKMAEGIESTEELAASFFMTEGRKRSVGELQLSRIETDQKKFTGCSMVANVNIYNKITG